MISFACPLCRASLKAPEDKAGAPSRCRFCGGAVQVPTILPGSQEGERRPAGLDEADDCSTVLLGVLLGLVAPVLLEAGVALILYFLGGYSQFEPIGDSAYSEYRQYRANDRLVGVLAGFALSLTGAVLVGAGCLLARPRR
jgi:hypothetical protein